MPDKFWNAEKGVDIANWAKDYNEHVAFRAADDVRRLTLPATSEAYKVELPSSFKPPEGIKFNIDSADPLWAQARAWAHKNGLSQEAFAEGIGLIAGRDVGTEQKIQDARNAQIAKLGATGTARVTAATTFFKSILGEEAGQQFMNRMVLASDIESAEKLITRFASQGGGSFRQTGREVEVEGRLPAGPEGDKIWAGMTYSQQKEYSEKHQPRQNGAG